MLERRLLLTVINGNITSNQTWTPSQSPYEIQGNVRLTEGVTLNIQPNTQVKIAGNLEVNGQLIANQAAFEFTSFGDLLVRKASSNAAIPRLQVNQSSFSGNPNREDDLFMAEAGADVSITASQFDAYIKFTSETESVVFDNNNLQGTRPIRVTPNTVVGLFDNQFVNGAVIETAGDFTQNATWRPFSGVKTFETVSPSVNIKSGAILTVDQSAELALAGTIYVEGELRLDSMTLNMPNFSDLYLQGAQSFDGKGHLQANNVDFVGNPSRTDEYIYLEENSTANISNSRFDAASYFWSESNAVVLNNNVFNGPDPILVRPSQVEDLYDNQFLNSTPLWIGVTGALVADSTWRPFSNVRGYRVRNGDVQVPKDLTLTIEPRTEVRLTNSLIVEGDVIASQTDFYFESFGDIYLQGAQSFDGKGNLDVASSRWFGNPDRSDDYLFFEKNSTVNIVNSTFDGATKLWSETDNLILDGNTFAGDRPIHVTPGQATDLLDNQFSLTESVWLEVEGDLLSNTTWSLHSSVVGFDIVGSGVTVRDGITLDVRPETALTLSSTLWVEGLLQMDSAKVVFATFGDIYVQGAQSFDPKGRVTASRTQFQGNPNRQDDWIQFEANSTGLIADSTFDSSTYLFSETTGLVLNRNRWAAADPLTVLPGQIQDLYDNQFTASTPVLLGVAGDLNTALSWRRFSQVAGYLIRESGMTIRENAILEIEPGTAVQLASQLYVEGTMRAVDADIYFDSHADIYVQGAQSFDPKGRVEISDSRFWGNAQRSDDMLYFEQNSTGLLQGNQFDPHVTLTSLTNLLQMDQNQFAGSRSVTVAPDQVLDLGDNTFTAEEPSYVSVTGELTRNATWQSTNGVTGYQLATDFRINEGVTLQVGANTRVEVNTQADIFGTLKSNGGVFVFPSFSRIVVQGESSFDPKGSLEFENAKLVGNPDRNDDGIVFEANSSGLFRNTDLGIDVGLSLSPAANVLFEGQQSFGTVTLERGGSAGLVIGIESGYWGTLGITDVAAQQSIIEGRVIHRPDDSARGTLDYTPWLTAPPRGTQQISDIFPAQPVGGSVNYVDVQFKLPLRSSTVTKDRFTITAPGSSGRSVTVNSVELLSDSRVRIHFANEVATSSNQGTYTVRIAPSLQDLTGTALDGNANGIPNEQDDSLSSTFELVRIVPTPSAVSSSTMAWVAGQPAQVSWTVSNLTSFDLRGGWVDHVYLSTDGTLDASDVLLGTFSHDEVLESGGSDINDAQVVIPGVLPGNRFLIVASIPTGTQRDAADPVASSPARLITVSPLNPTDATVQAVLSAADGSDYYRVNVLPGRRLELNGHATGGNIQVLVAKDRIPIRTQGSSGTTDFDFGTTGFGASFDLRGPVAGEATTYFVRIDRASNANSLTYNLNSRIVDVPPRIVSISPAGETIAPIDNWSIKFDRPMDTSSFSIADDVYTAAGPGGDLVLSSEWTDPTTLVLRFPASVAPGQYTLGLRPSVSDLNGWELDTDGDLRPGESTDDRVIHRVALKFSGTINDDKVIPRGTVLVIDSNVVISQGASLTIEPGAVLKFKGGASLTVNGKLSVFGTAGQPVRMTSIHDLSVAGEFGDNSRAPRAGDWGGIRAGSATAQIEIDHLQVRYASTAVNADVPNLGLVKLSNIDFRYGSYGIYVYSPFVDLRISNAVIAGFSSVGIHVRADSRAEISNATIVDNGQGVHHGAAHITLLNSIVAFNRNAGWDHSGDQPEILIARSLFYQPNSTNLTWSQSSALRPDLAANGNLVADPVFRDWQNGDYRIGDNSPAIDSAAAYFSNPIWQPGVDNPVLTAPALDLLGRARVDDLGASNTGFGNPVFMDRGALERIEESPHRDLVVEQVAVVGAVSDYTPGSNLSIAWTVSNPGSIEISAGWDIDFYLSADANTFEGAPWRSVTVNEVLGAGQDFSSQLSAPLPSSAVGPLRVVAVVNPQRRSGESNYQNNVGSSAQVVRVNVPRLQVGQTVQGTVPARQWVYYQVDADQQHGLLASLISGNPRLDFYLRKESGPTLQRFDAIGEPDPATGNKQLRMPSAVGTTYYIGVRSSANSTSQFSLSLQASQLAVREVTPARIGVGGASTLTVLGDAFEVGSTIVLKRGDATLTSETHWIDSTQLLSVVRPDQESLLGTWDLQITSPSGTKITRPAAVTIAPAVESTFRAELTLPGLARPGRVVSVRIPYENTGLSDIAAPIIRLTSSNESTSWLAPGSRQWVTGSTFQFLAVGDESLPTILPAGYKQEAIVQVRLPYEQDRLDLQMDWYGVEPTGSGAELVDWAKLRLEYPNPEARDVDWTELHDRVGTTWWELAESLRRDHVRLRQLGNSTTSIQEIFDDLFDLVLGLGEGDVAGVLRDSRTGEPLPGVELTLSAERESGTIRVVTTAEDGGFRFRRLTNDRYWLGTNSIELSEDYSFVINEDNQIASADVTASPYLAQEQAQEPADHSKLLSVMVEGVPHLVIERDGGWYHTWSNALGWTPLQAVPKLEGATLSQVEYSPSLFGAGQPGLVLLSSVGQGNDLRIVYTAARPLAGDSWEWSETTAYVDSTVSTGRPLIAFTDDQTPVVLYQMFDAEADDDIDYYSISKAFGFSPTKFSKSDFAELVALAESIAPMGPLLPSELDMIRRTFDRSNTNGDDCCSDWKTTFEESFDIEQVKSLGTILEFLNEYFPIKAKLKGKVAGSASVKEVSAKGTGTAEVVIGSGRGANGEKHKITGELDLEAKWTLDPTTCSYYSDTISIGLSIGGEVTVPFYYFKVPFIGGVEVNASFAQQIGGKVTYTSGLAYSESISGTFTGKTTIKPAFETVIGDGLLGAKLTAGGVLVVPTDLYPEPRFGSASGGFFVKLDFGYYSYSFSYTASLDGVQELDLSTGVSPFVSRFDSQSPGLTLTLNQPVGSTAVYGNNAVDRAVANNRVHEHGATIITGSDGRVYAFWQKETATPEVALGSKLVWSVWNGDGWSIPTEVSGSQGFGGQVAATTLPDGQTLVVWPQGDTSGLSLSSNPSDVLVAMDEADLYYSVVSAAGVASPASRLANVPGRADGVTLMTDESGRVLVSWLEHQLGDAADDALFAAQFDAGVWSTPIVVDEGRLEAAAAFIERDGTPQLVWIRASESDGASTQVVVANWLSGTWGYPVVVDTTIPDEAAGNGSSKQGSGVGDGLSRSGSASAVRAATGDSLGPGAFLGMFTVLKQLAVGPPAECCEPDPEEEVEPCDDELEVCAPEDPAVPNGPSGNEGSGTGGSIPIFVSATPEDKFGPVGYDAPDTPASELKRYIGDDEALLYRIEIWNKEDALVPTQDAIIVDYLDPNRFDLSTFKFTRAGFMDWDVQLEDAQGELKYRIDPRPNLDFVVDVVGTLDYETGRVIWTMQAIDPLTGDYPADPMAGFLPPFNPVTRYELGWVEFTVSLRRDLASGTVISNQAFVEFDYLEQFNACLVGRQFSIDQPGNCIEDSGLEARLIQHPAPKEGPWTNTLDASSPQSRVTTLPAQSYSNFRVSWEGTDSGSGIGIYDVFVAIDSGAFAPWLVGTNEPSAVYHGAVGHVYKFAVVATDRAGNREQKVLGTEASTSVVLGTPLRVKTLTPSGAVNGVLEVEWTSATNMAELIRAGVFSQAVILRDSNSQMVSLMPENVTYDDTVNRLRLVLTGLPAGEYRLTLMGNVIDDRDGNAMWGEVAPVTGEVIAWDGGFIGGMREHTFELQEASWTNTATPWDVNANGIVQPIDALVVINYLNRNPSGALPQLGAGFGPPPFFDVNSDGIVTPIDALIVINYLNRNGGGESEPSYRMLPSGDDFRRLKSVPSSIAEERDAQLTGELDQLCIAVDAVFSEFDQ